MAARAQSGGTPAQVCMTLSAIAATAATRRPSGETRQEHEQRIMRGITYQLNDPELATGGDWQLLWLGLTRDNANLAYIAGRSDGSGEFAVAVRGTVFTNPIDLLQDVEVGRTSPFKTGGSPAEVKVSKGAMDAFRQIVEHRGTQPGGDAGEHIGPSRGVTLTRALDELTGALDGATVCVTGHSLGGCVATMLGPYLQQQTWRRTPKFALATFAAPTAGLQSFADYVDSLTWSLQERHVNAYDIVPLAWADLTTAENWYPQPGPAADDKVKTLLSKISKLPDGHVYVQPGSPPSS